MYRRPLLPWALINSIWISTSPHSTFCNLRIMVCVILPFSHTMQLSSDKQFSLFGWTLSTFTPSGRPCNPMFIASRYGFMSIFAFPILSSAVNVSLSYTVYQKKKREIEKRTIRQPIYITRKYGNNYGILSAILANLLLNDPN